MAFKIGANMAEELHSAFVAAFLVTMRAVYTLLWWTSHFASGGALGVGAMAMTVAVSSSVSAVIVALTIPMY